jgi:hypothetical protein
MATGFEVPTPRKGRVELNISDPSLDAVVDVLNKIFHTTDHFVRCMCLTTVFLRQLLMIVS